MITPEQHRGITRGLFLRSGVASLVGIAAASIGVPPSIIRPAKADGPSCEFTLGFKVLHDMIPNIVGKCQTNERHNPQNGDGLQETTGIDGKGGLLVWRKADNWTAYTDGNHTWVNGPNGLQTRLNIEKFPWEQESKQQVSQVWEDTQWYPLSAQAGLHTLYELGGPLDYYDSLSTLVGPKTNFRQQVEDFSNWYFSKFTNLTSSQRNTSGFCHGVANAVACGEPEPVGDNRAPRYIKVGLLAALHSGDGMYQPGIEQLVKDLTETGRLFVIETVGSDGYWSRVVYGVEGNRFKVTNFARGPKTISLGEIKNAYVPVPEGEEGNFRAGMVTSVPDEWKIRLNGRLVRNINYGTPLG